MARRHLKPIGRVMLDTICVLSVKPVDKVKGIDLSWILFDDQFIVLLKLLVLDVLNP